MGAGPAGGPSTGSRLTRHLVTVGGRQVLVRRGGSGPPFVLLHESPLSSRSLEWLAEPLAERFTVLALDTPGYGLSDPLPLDRPGIPDYADALACTLDALGVERCAVFGTLTGALIALSFAERHPDRTAAAVLDRLPIFAEADRAELLARYLPPLEPQLDGSHLLWLWQRLVDQYIFWPWYRRERAARVVGDIVPEPAEVHEQVLEVLRAGNGYSAAYAAAFRWPGAAAALTRLRVPTAIVLRSDDALDEHLARLPAGLPACCTVERVDPATYAAQVGDATLARLPQGLVPPPAQRHPAALPDGPALDFATTPEGQLLVRRAGKGGDRPLVLLHRSPGSGAGLLPLARELAAARRVVALDTLGEGGSDRPRSAGLSIADHARVVLAALTDLGIGRFDLYGVREGAAIAVEVALAATDRVGALALEEAGGTLTAAQRARRRACPLAPPPPRADGSHLLAAWSALRDEAEFDPWYERTPAAARRGKPCGVDELHRRVVELLACGGSAPLVQRAALDWEAEARLPLLGVRTLVHADRSGLPAAGLTRFLDTVP